MSVNVSLINDFGEEKNISEYFADMDDFMSSMRTIKTFARDKKNNKVGVFIAFSHDDNDSNSLVAIGFSFCDTRFDTFNSEYGKNKAIDMAFNFFKAVNIDNIYDKVPYAQKLALIKFLHRCEQYFHNKKLPYWANGILMQNKTISK